MDFIYSIIGFTIAITILVFVHELGHFAIARLFKVRVLKFSIGFGPGTKIGTDKLGTQYFISAIPLGGYIQLLDTSIPVSDDLATNNTNNLYLEGQKAINEQSPMIKIAILLAGPMFNLIFAWIIYLIVFIIGISSHLPIIGTIRKGSIADLSGLYSGLQITKISDQPVYDWNNVATRIFTELSNHNVNLKIETYDHKLLKSKIHNLKLNVHKSLTGDLLDNLGLEPLVFMDPKISQLIGNLPAAKSGLKVGDVIISIDHLLMTEPQQVYNYIHDKIGKTLSIKVLRAEQILYFNVQPTLRSIKDPKQGAVIGIKYKNLPYPKEFTTIQKYGFVDAFKKSFIKTYDNITVSLSFLLSIFKGKLSLDNTAGPLAIGYYAGQHIKHGVEYFLNFLGMISINLGILNLLPIPWLDGGSIMHSMYELLMRKPAPYKIVHFFRTISLFFLIGLTILVFIHDLIKL